MKRSHIVKHIREAAKSLKIDSNDLEIEAKKKLYYCKYKKYYPSSPSFSYVHKNPGFFSSSR